MRQFLGRLLCALGLAGGLLATRASADDWLQFRKDGARTGASRDRVNLPLTDLWTYRGRSSDKQLLLRAPVAWRGRVFFISQEPPHPFIVCADARTGIPIWKQPLGRSGPPGPFGEGLVPFGLCVTEEGIVYAYDRRRFVQPDPYEPLDGYGRRRMQSVGCSALVAYRASDGAYLGASPILVEHSPRAPLTEIPRIFLADGFSPPSTAWDYFASSASRNSLLGPPLVMGPEIVGVSGQDLFFRAGVNSQASLVTLSHLPPGNPDPNRVLRSAFNQYPMALSGNGIVVASDGADRYLAVLGGGGQPIWHRDMPWTMGIPATQNGLIFMGVGGMAASNGIAAIEAATGNVRWVHRIAGIAPDPLDGVMIETLHWQVLTEVERSGRTEDGTPTARLRSLGGYSSGSRPLGRNAVNIGATLVNRPDALDAGHRGNIPLVAASERVFGSFGGWLFALEQQTGAVAWERRLPIMTYVRATVASKDHLFVLFSSRSQAWQHAVFAFRLDNGKQEWSQVLPVSVTSPDAFALADGVLYIADGRNLYAFGTAERTFHLAVDSSRKEDYLREILTPLPPDPVIPSDVEGSMSAPAGKDPDQPAPGQAAGDSPTVPVVSPIPAVPQTPLPATRPAPGKVTGQQRAPAPGDAEVRVRQDTGTEMADATVLRLNVRDDLQEWLRQARARQEVAPGLPMLVSLEWLSADRSQRSSARPDDDWSQPEIDVLAHKAARFAEAIRPEHLDLGPEVNVWLARFPERLPTVQTMVREVAASVKRVAPDTRTLISLNREVLSRSYGLTDYRPFGELPKLPRQQAMAPLVLIELVDEVGITSHPQAALGLAALVPSDYFSSLKPLLGRKPLLVTRLSTRLWPRHPEFMMQQASYLKRLLQACYWLDARMVAYPDPDPRPLSSPDQDTAIRSDKEPRLANAVWRDVLRWKRVERLSIPLLDTWAAQK